MEKLKLKNSKCKLIVFLILILIVNAFVTYLIFQYSSSKVEYYIGRMMRASLRSHGDFRKYIKIEKPAAETSEDILQEMINNNVWNKFTFKEKQEFVLASLIGGDIQGGTSTILLIMMQKDSIPIAKNLEAIPDSLLKEKFSLSDDGIKSFKQKLKFYKGDFKYPKKLKEIMKE